MTGYATFHDLRGASVFIILMFLHMGCYFFFLTLSAMPIVLGAVNSKPNLL